MSKKVTVAIPTYNRIPYLKECIESILNQTFQDFSIFVFDNASTESVERELKKFNDPRIQFIGSEENLGAEGNMNRIVEHSFESEYVVMFHDDDTMHPEMLELQVAFLDAHKDAQFVLTDLQRGSDNTMQDFPEIDAATLHPIVYKNSYEFIRAQMSWLRYGFPSVLYRVGAFGETRIRPEFFHFLDMVFLAEISKKGSCALLPAPLMIHRIHAGQYTERSKDEYKQGVTQLLMFLRENLPSPLSKGDEKLFHKHAVNSLLRACAHINSGLFESVRFLKESRRKKLLQWKDFQYIDARGAVSIISILFKSRRIIDTARWLKNLFQ